MKIRNSTIIYIAIFAVILGGWFLFGGNDAGPSVSERSVDFVDPSEERSSSDGNEQFESPEDIPMTQAVLLDVPFAAQAPFGNWDDPRQQDGCEEVSALMAVRWAEGRGLTLSEAESEIIAISDWENENYGEFHDSSVADTVERIFKGYFGFTNVRVQYDITTEDIKQELYQGNLVIVPTNGQRLNNPNFTGSGPERHMFPVIGYDPNTKEFISNDNGTKNGKGYRYSESVLQSALRDYETGYKKPIVELRTAMIVVSK